MKRIKLLKLSTRYLRCAYRPILELFRRLLHGISHKLGSSSPGHRPSITYGIMGATEPTQNDTLVIHPGETLAVPPLKNLLENGLSSQRGIETTMQMPTAMDQSNTASIPDSSAVPNVSGRRPVFLWPIVATQIRRYDRDITQYVLFVFCCPRTSLQLTVGSISFVCTKSIQDLMILPSEEIAFGQCTFVTIFCSPSMEDPNWLRLTHPEGARYFFNQVQVRRDHHGSQVTYPAMSRREFSPMRMLGKMTLHLKSLLPPCKRKNWRKRKAFR